MTGNDVPIVPQIDDVQVHDVRGGFTLVAVRESDGEVPRVRRCTCCAHAPCEFWQRPHPFLSEQHI
jgi:hypothetical protein